MTVGMGFMQTDLDQHCLLTFSSCTFSLSEVKKIRWICPMTISNATADTLYAFTVNFILPCRLVVRTYIGVIVTDVAKISVTNIQSLL